MTICLTIATIVGVFWFAVWPIIRIGALADEEERP